MEHHRRSKKVDSTLAELHKLHNQIRIELNRIRPYHGMALPQKQSRSARKMFPEKSRSTSLFGPSEKERPPQRLPSKKLFDKNLVVKTEDLKQNSRKHYQNTFKDQVKMIPASRRTQSSYLNIRPSAQHSPNISPNKQMENTSLIGIGAKDKSNQQIRPGKRIISTYHIFNFDLV